VILGGVLVGGATGNAATVILNAANAATAVPSLTLTTMFESTPTSLLAGVPLSRPVLVLNEIHDGLPLMENTSGFLSGSEADGWNA
jgi:hypothetical protein